MYALDSTQVSIMDRTIFLDKTKNGDKRRVPLSNVAVASLKRHGRGKGLLFPWELGRQFTTTDV